MVVRICGVIRGRHIALKREPGLSDGAAVTVRLETNGPSLDERRRRMREVCGAWGGDDSLGDVSSHSRFASYALPPANE